LHSLIYNSIYIDLAHDTMLVFAIQGYSNTDCTHGLRMKFPE